jgi:hypothetical protein
LKTFEQLSQEIDEKLSSGLRDQIAAKNPEHPFLQAFKNDDEFEELKSLWDEGKHDEAARMFRAKLTKIANSKLGTSLLLMVSGAALTSMGYNALKPVPPHPPVPKPPIPPHDDTYVIKKGDSFWKIAKQHLPKGASNADINAYMRQLAKDNMLKTKLIDGVLSKIPKDPDLIFPGGRIFITKFLGK